MDFMITEYSALYLDNLKASGASSVSIGNYRRTIASYATFCANKKEDPTIPATVVNYKLHLSKDRACKLVTVQYHLNVLRQFFAFCVRALRVLTENPVLDDLDVSKKKLANERKPYGDKLLSEQEIKALIKSPRPARMHNEQFLRNRAIVLTLVLTGLRNAELLALTAKDLRFGKDGYIVVRSGKGDKYRTVPFPNPAQLAILDYLRESRPHGLSANAPLFGVGNSAENWSPIDRCSLSTTVRRYVEHATGHKGERTHALRHAYASNLLSHGVPVQDLQRSLGHSSIQTTERYAQLLDPKRSTAQINDLLNSLY